MTIGECAYWACLLEVTARKPGNVHREQDFPRLTYEDFTMSAAAIAPILNQAPGRLVGEVVLECVRATAQDVNRNTNLGIVLLAAPLAVGDDIGQTLDSLTVDDAQNVYEAIRLAKPGGMGEVTAQDIATTPTGTLREAMALAADRDSIARQYVNNFADVYAGAQHLASQRVYPDGSNLEEAIIDLHLWFLSRLPDSLVQRKRGDAEAQQLQALAQAAIKDRANLPALLNWFAAAFPQRNPGTTADLVCASLFVALRQGIITLPLSPDWPTTL
jgi:triphosphoribosyl-dephospho-CoA synthase